MCVCAFNFATSLLRYLHVWVILLFAMHSRICSIELHTAAVNQLGGQVALLGFQVGRWDLAFAFNATAVCVSAVRTKQANLG